MRDSDVALCSSVARTVSIDVSIISECADRMLKRVWRRPCRRWRPRAGWHVRGGGGRELEADSSASRNDVTQAGSRTTSYSYFSFLPPRVHVQQAHRVSTGASSVWNSY